MGGVPANQLVSAPSQRLLATMLEFDGLLKRWGGNIYLLDQTTEGITNRRGVGAEVRYSGDLLSTYTLLDYDIKLKGLNAASLQGSIEAPGNTMVTVLLDSRKAPSLQLTNALISSGVTSLNTLLQMKSLAEVQDAAKATSANARQALLSLSRPVGEKWQATGDLRYSAVGALPAVGNFEATPATGGQISMSAQLTGSNLYSARDINGFSLTLMHAPTFKGTQLGYTNLTGFREGTYTLEPSFRLYTQSDNQGVKLTRMTPALRGTWRATRRMSLLGETIYEHTNTEGPASHDTTSSTFFYVGYRYDLF